MKSGPPNHRLLDRTPPLEQNGKLMDCYLFGGVSGAEELDALLSLVGGQEREN